MPLNRRTFIVSATALAAVRPMVSLSAQSAVTSGGIGLTLADVRSMYEELPPGQTFLNFAEPTSGTVLYIDFGDNDFAQSIWVSGELDEATATTLITWLCPDDIEAKNQYEMLAGAGSIAFENLMTFDSPFLAGFDPARRSIMAKYVLEPTELGVKSLILTVEKAAASRG